MSIKYKDVFFYLLNLNGPTMFRKIEILYLKRYDIAPKNSLHRILLFENVTFREIFANRERKITILKTGKINNTLKKL